MEQLRVAPLRTWELILGKTIPYLGISLLATVIILLAARVLFGVTIRGPYLDLLVAVLLYLFGALGFGLLISTIANTQALAFQAGLIASMLPGDPALRLHLPDPDHAGAAAGRHLPRPRALLPRDPARDHPQGRGARHLLAAGRRPRALRRSPRWRSPRCASRGGRPEVRVLWRVIVKEFLQIRRDRKMIPVIFVAPDRPDHRLRLRRQHRRDQRAHGPRRPGPQRGEPRPGEPLRRVRLLRARRHRRAGGGGRPLARHLEGPARPRDRRGLRRGRSPPPGRPPSSWSWTAPTPPPPTSPSATPRPSPATSAPPSWSGACARPAPALPAVGQAVLVPRVFYNPDLKSRWFYVPAVLAMILMIMTMLLSAMGVVREKEIGTMEQLIVTPIRPWQLLVGKLLPFALIGLVPDVRRHRGHRLRLRRAAARLVRAAPGPRPRSSS